MLQSEKAQFFEGLAAGLTPTRATKVFGNLEKSGGVDLEVSGEGR